MEFLPESIIEVMEELGRLPGVGPKSAQRLTFHLLKQADGHLMSLGDAISNVRNGVVRCKECFCLSSQEVCKICENVLRDRSKLCVVESTLDLIAIERTGEYKGLYHILQGKISPLNGIGPEELRMAELFSRVTNEENPIKEVILALNPDLEGDTTALFLHKKLSTFQALQVTRIARGIPSGGNLEYSDDATLIRAMQGRQLLS